MASPMPKVFEAAVEPLKLWNDLRDTVYVTPAYLIESMIPESGLVLIWGRSSVGKTPLAWHMARSISTGEEFGGYKTTKSPVLFIELDQPERLTADRIKELPALPADAAPLCVEHLPPFETPLTKKAEDRLIYLRDQIHPKAVFIDTLRKAHSLDDSSSETVQIVYAQFLRLFPNTALIFIHHERKTGLDDHRPPEESFSGSRAWINDSQVGVHATKSRDGVTLTFRKNQFGPIDWSVRFTLTDGATLVSTRSETELIQHIVMTVDKRKRTAEVAAKLGISESSARRKVRDAERHLMSAGDGVEDDTE